MTIQSPSIDMTAGTPVGAAPVAASRGYWVTVGRRLRRDPVTLACLGILVLIVLAALAAPWLGLADPYKTSMIRRLLHHFGSHWVEFNVGHASQKIGLTFNQIAAIPAFPQGTYPIMAHIEMPHITAPHRLHQKR